MPTLGIDQPGDEMYVVELDFDDDPRRLDARPTHRERLQALSSEGTLVLAGPWADDRGALLVFDLPGEAALQEAMAQDHYYRAPGVTVRRIREWKPIAGQSRRRPGTPTVRHRAETTGH